MLKEDKSQAYRNEYQRQHYDRVTILLPKGSKQALQEIAKTKNKTVTQLIVEALADAWLL